MIILRWRTRAAPIPFRSHLLLFLAFASLGASFAARVLFVGAFFFLQKRFPEASFNVLAHGLQTAACLFLAASAYDRSPSRELKGRLSSGALLTPLLLFAPLGSLLPQPELGTAALMDLMNLILLVIAIVLFYRRPLSGHQLGTFALALMFAAVLLHLAPHSLGALDSALLWNLEQGAWLLSLFIFALAIGEASRDLFGKVFVRLQIAFVLLASLMILGITQTERTEYLTSIRSRSDRLAEFVRAHVEHFLQRDDSLPRIVQQEDFLQQLTLGFGELPELRRVRIIAANQVAVFEIADNGLIHRNLGALSLTPSSSVPDPDEYFLIQARPLKVAGPGAVEFYGAHEFLSRHARKRIVLIFSLFTGMVALSTLMIGLVVRGASATIERQAGEIEATQCRLLQASKLAAIGELAAGVAHEINNPATIILSRASFMLSQEDGNSSSSDQEDLNAIVSQAQRIAQITRGLLAFSRPQALKIQATSIASVIEASLRPVAELLTGHGIRVDRALELDLPQVMVDAGSVSRALENIFRNAIDAMPAGGALGIRATSGDPSGTLLRLEVSDTGMGIEGKNLARIFDPFFTTKEVGKGTGLGLSIAHEIIKEHHGTIAVESQPGVGTTFMIVLPTER